MANRQTSDTTSSTTYKYAKPGTWANNQNDILLSQEATSTTLTSNQGSTNFQSPTIPITSITESGTTATVNFGSPIPNYVNTSTTMKISLSGTGYDGSYTVTSIAGAPYQVTITATSGLGTLNGGSAVATFSGTTATASTTVFTPAGQYYRPAVQGSTINGNVVGTLEVWGDKAVWDETNSVYYASGVQFPARPN